MDADIKQLNDRFGSQTGRSGRNPDRHQQLGPGRQERRPGHRLRSRGHRPGRQRRQLRRQGSAAAGAPGRTGARDVVERFAGFAGLPRAAPERARRPDGQEHHRDARRRRRRLDRRRPAGPHRRRVRQRALRPAQGRRRARRNSAVQRRRARRARPGRDAVDRHEEGPGRDQRRFQEPVQRAGRGRTITSESNTLLGAERSAVPRAYRVRLGSRTPASSATSGCRSCPVSPRSSPSPACCSR